MSPAPEYPIGPPTGAARCLGTCRGLAGSCDGAGAGPVAARVRPARRTRRLRTPPAPCTDGGPMTTLQTSSDTATEASGVTRLAMRFEVTTLPVADVDRAKAFYQRLGWRLDIDFNPTPDTRG